MLRTKTAIIAFLMVLGMSAAHAAPVILTDVGTQTISGQNFNFNFGALPPSDGTGGTFVLRGVGDYDGSDDETLSWDIEGLTGSTCGRRFLQQRCLGHLHQCRRRYCQWRTRWRIRFRHIESTIG